MKTVLKIVGGIVVCLLVALIVLRITGLEPHNTRPGLWLKGDVVTTPVTDWSFTDKYRTLKLQTNSWYGLPHSVTITCTAYNRQLYIDSVYGDGGDYPHGRRWNDNVARDPHVRIKVGNQLYDRTLVPVTDPAEIEAIETQKRKKYHGSRAPKNSTVVVFHVVDN